MGGKGTGSVTLLAWSLASNNSVSRQCHAALEGEVGSSLHGSISAVPHVAGLSGEADDGQ